MDIQEQSSQVSNSSLSNKSIKQSTIEKAAAQFGIGEPKIETLGEGLIHRTYKVNYPVTGKTIVLQCINQTTFPQPENIINNYRLLSQYLKENGNSFSIPEIILTTNGKLFWRDEEENFWRAAAFIENSYAPASASTENEAYLAAKSFAQFTASLSGIDADKLDVIIPDFHNLSFRYQQFETAIQKASMQRLLRSTHVIAELRQRKKLLNFFEQLKNNPQYKLRVMHHDCKISNILFDKTTKQVICPVDLDTTMPGYYFSDIGDMMRTMACTVDENSTRWEDIDVRKEYYDAILQGYLEGIGDTFTEEEKENIHQSGMLMTYMQALRFVTDFLNNDIYYKTTYPEQNLNRALNQLILLEKFEDRV